MTPPPPKQLREHDRPARRPPGPPPEASPFLGDWSNTDPGSPGISRAVVTVRDGAPWIAVYCHGSVEEGPARAYFDAADPRVEIGMEAQVGDARLVMNVKHGVLVIAAYRTPPGAPPRYAREFYRPGTPQRAPDSSTPLRGAWVNVRAGSPALRELRIGDDVEAVSAGGDRVRGALRPATRAGESIATAFLAELPEPAPYLVAGNLNRGLLVLWMQTRPAAGASVHHREFFARVES